MQAAGGMAEFKRGWPVLTAAIVGIYASLATIPFYAVQGLIKPLNEAFGWSRGEISLAISVMALGNFLTSYVTGMLVDRFGARGPALVSGMLFGLSLIGLTFVGGPAWTLWLGYFVMTVAGAATLPLTYTRAINTWFDKARGLALGLTLLGTSLAAMTMPHLYRAAIEQWGWQGVFYVGAGLVFVVWLPIALLLFRDRPATEQAAAAALATGRTLFEAVRTPAYWIMGAAFFLVTCAMSGIVIHIIAMVTDNGVPPEQAAVVASVIGLSLLCARVIVGWLVDHFFAPPIAALCFAVPAIGCYLLTGGGHGSAIVAAILVGVALGAELDLIAYFTSRYYGMKNYGKIYSWQYVFYTAGAGLSPFVFGAVYDRFGSYDPALYGAMGALLFAGAIMLLLPRYPVFEPVKPAEPA